MLQEILPTEVGMYNTDDIIVLNNDTVYTFDEFMDSSRFLVDLATDDEDEEIEDDGEEFDEDEEDDDPEEEPEEDEDPEPKRRTKAQIIELITEAVSDGRKSIADIMEATGLTYNTVKRYLEKMEED